MPRSDNEQIQKEIRDYLDTLRKGYETKFWPSIGIALTAIIPRIVKISLAAKNKEKLYIGQAGTEFTAGFIGIILNSIGFYGMPTKTTRATIIGQYKGYAFLENLSQAFRATTFKWTQDYKVQMQEYESTLNNMDRGEAILGGIADMGKALHSAETALGATVANENPNWLGWTNAATAFVSGTIAAYVNYKLSTEVNAKKVELEAEKKTVKGIIDQMIKDMGDQI